MKSSQVEESRTAVEEVLRGVYELGPVTSIELSEHLQVSGSQASSALSRLHKRIPEILTRDTLTRPYKWKADQRVAPEEAYKKYLRTPVEAYVAEEIQRPEPTSPTVPGEFLEADAALRVVVEVTGRIDISVGWAGKL